MDVVSWPKDLYIIHSALPRSFQHSGAPIPSTALFLWCGHRLRPSHTHLLGLKMGRILIQYMWHTEHGLHMANIHVYSSQGFFFLHRAKRGNLPLPPLNFLGSCVYYVHNQATHAHDFETNPTTLRAYCRHIHLWGLERAYWSIFPLFETFVEKPWF